MDQLTNLPVFKSIQISLACQACIDAEKAHEWCVRACYCRWPQGFPMFCSVLTHVTSPMWQPAHAAFDSAVAGCRQASPAENHHERPSRFNQLGNGRRGVQQCRSVLQAVAVETNVPRDYPATDRIQHAFLRHHRPCCWWRALGLCDGVVHMQSRHIQGVCLPACTCVFETSLEEEIHNEGLDVFKECLVRNGTTRVPVLR